MLARWRRMSALLLLEQRDGHAEHDGRGDRQRPERVPQIAEMQRLVEHAPADGEHVARRIDLPDDASRAFERRNRRDEPRELHRGHHRADHREEQRGDLALGERGGEQADGGRAQAVKHARREQGREAAFDRHAEQRNGEEHHQQEVEHREQHVRRLLAEQEFEPRDRRDVEVDDRAEFLFAHHGERGEHGGHHQQQHGDHGGHHRGQAAHVGVVAKACFDGHGGMRVGAQTQLRLFEQPALMHAHDVAAHGFRALRHRAVDPHADLHRLAARHVACEARWNLDREREFAAAHALVHVRVARQRRPLDEVARAREIQLVVVRERGAVVIEHREAQILHVHADAEAHHEQQQQRARERERRAHGVAPQFERLAPHIAPRALQAEAAMLLRMRGGVGIFGQHGEFVAGVFLGARARIHEPGDERFFERGRAAIARDVRGRVAHQHAARVHQRNAVAAPGLVHEVRGDEDRHLIFARERDQQAPEVVARDRIDARGRFVEDQQLGLVDHRHREREPLAHAERQAVGQRVERVGEVEALDHFVDARRNVGFGHMKQTRVQHQILAHREFAIERKRLRHVAHAAARVEVARIDFVPEQPGFAFGRGQQAREHFHRRRLAAAVRAEKAENLAALNAKAHVIDGHEVAETHRQVFGLDGDFGVLVDVERHDLDRLVAAFFRLGQQRDEGFFERVRVRAFEQFGGLAGREHRAVVHRDQPVEALRLVHVRGRDDHAHRRAFLADAVDEVPELRARERVDARGRFVEDQQVGVVDQRAAQAELLLHAAREFARGAREKRIEAGAARERVDAAAALVFVVAEQAAEELQILFDRERGIEVLAEPLRHVGDARADVVAMLLARHVAAEHAHNPLLHLARARDQRKQARLAHAVRADHADHQPGGDVLGDVVKRDDLAVVQADVLEANDGFAHQGTLILSLSGHSSSGSSLTQATPGRPVFTYLRCA
ncbi:hypothetical protein PT2222_230055 [Paraburkholderia tropica]